MLRRRFRTLTAIAVAMTGAALLQGCVVAAVGAGATAGYQLAQERSIEDQFRDNALSATIGQVWRQYEPKLAENLDDTVYEGRVLLTGRVPNPEWRDIAVKLVWRQKGVREVYNEIQVGPGSDFAQRSRDTWISTQLRTTLIGDGAVRSVNYTISTVNGNVYLIGSARDRRELDEVVNQARNVPGVRKVVSYVRIRDGEPPRGAPPPPPPDNPPPDYGTAPPPPNYGAPPPDYNTPPSSPGYGAPPGAYTAPSPSGYGSPPPASGYSPPPAGASPGYTPPPPRQSIEVTPLK